MTDLATEVGSVNWYHTIDLPGGVVTPGFYDTREALRRVPMPSSLDGRRCLDVGTCDGFWAFSMEARGAREVVGIDLIDPARRDWPVLAGGGDPEARRDDRGRSETTFGIASRAFGSKVQRVDLSVYDVSPEALGEFDLVFIGSLLLHLRDPVGALAALRTVTAGRLLVNDAVSRTLTRMSPRVPLARLHGQEKPLWWKPNLAALGRMVESAGFRIVRSGRPYRLPFGQGFPSPSTARGRMRIRAGSLHAWVLAVPA